MAYSPDFWLITKDGDQAQLLEEALAELGHRTLTNVISSYSGHETLLPDTPVYVDMVMVCLSAGENPEEIQSLNELIIKIRAHTTQQHHVQIILLTPNDEIGNGHETVSNVDEFLSLPFNKVHLKARLHSLLRLNLMYQEYSLRCNTNDRFGITHNIDLAVPDAPVSKILIYQKNGSLPVWVQNAPNLMLIDHEQDRDNAIQKLREEHYDSCVILDDAQQAIEATEFAEVVRRYARLYSLPLLLITKVDISELSIEEIIQSGITDVLDFDSPSGHIHNRLGFYIRQEQLRSGLYSFYQHEANGAICDGLTGFYNYGYFMDHAQSAIDKMENNRRPVTMCCLRMQGLEDINSKYGYAVGDYILRQIGVLIRRLHRAEDMAARLEGAYFGLLMPGTTVEQAELVLKRIMSVVRHTKLSHKDHGKLLPISVNGVAKSLNANSVVDQVVRQLRQQLS